MHPTKVGLFGIGLDAYWPQFKGLKQRLEGYLDRTAARLARPGIEVVNLGLVDSPPKAFDAGHRFGRRGRGPDLPPRDDLRAVLDRPARGASGQGAGDHPEPAARGCHRLRQLQPTRTAPA